MSMNPESRLVRQSPAVIELTEALSNVWEAYQQRDVSRTQVYDYHGRPGPARAGSPTYGPKGLKGLSPIHDSHPEPWPAF